MSKRRRSNKTIMPSIPEDFIREMTYALGEDVGGRLAEAIDEEPTVSIRLNKKKRTDDNDIVDRFAREGYNPRRVDWCKNGFHLDGRPDFTSDPLLHAGAYYVQEAASMVYESIVAEIVKSLSNERTLKALDMCAAPGGKSTAILNGLEGDYLLVANEWDAKRAGALEENLAKWGDPNVIVTNAETRAFRKLPGYFDIVAVDAPCSGEGMMRRIPVARSQWSRKLVGDCVRLQREIVADAVQVLAPGGMLIYSTCTFNVHEDDENVDWMVNEFGLQIIKDGERFMPCTHECEGLFVAVMRKPDDGTRFEPTPDRRIKSHPLPKEVTLINTEGLSGEYVGERIGETLYALPPHLFTLYCILKAGKVRVISAGVEVGRFKGDTLIPSSRQVLSTIFNSERIPLMDLDYKTAMEYLRNQAIALPADSGKGFVAVAYEGRPLGLVKNIGTRANNLYPRNWGIKRNEELGMRNEELGMRNCEAIAGWNLAQVKA